MNRKTTRRRRVCVWKRRRLSWLHKTMPVILCKLFYKKLKNVSCEYDRVNGWNSTLLAAWYIRYVRIIWFLWTKHTIWLLVLSFTQNIVRACSMFYPCEGYRSVTPLDAARVNRTIFHKKLKNVSCEYDRLNGWNLTLQAAWYIRHVRWTCLFYISFTSIIWSSWTKPMIWLLIVSFTRKKVVRACSVFILVKDIGRWLPWMLPGSTGWLSITTMCTDTI